MTSAGAVAKPGIARTTGAKTIASAKSAAEVISEEARIVAVPVDDFEAVLGGEPQIMRRFLLHALKEMEKYERRWAET